MGPRSPTGGTGGAAVMPGRAGETLPGGRFDIWAAAHSASAGTRQASCDSLAIVMRLLSTSFLLCFALGAQEKFVPIRGGDMPGRPGVRVDDFEMAHTPVTNAQYAEFIRATGHAAPEHFIGGAPPAGFGNHPVIYVNRYDVYDYLQWRSKKEGRIYRLPMAAEHEYAAKAGRDGLKYVWSESDPKNQTNYDETGDRAFADWKKHLKPVKSYSPNPWDLYDMSGNVWQMVGNEY
jgi:formylglycine-generating enzyme required for sulfatase activity